MESAFPKHRSPERLRSSAIRAGVVMGGLAMTALVLSACAGGSSPPGIASLGSTTTVPASGGTGGASATGGLGKGPSRSQLLKFSKCMQTHGIPDFPEPNATGDLIISGGPRHALNPGSQIFQKAQTACQKYSPRGHLTSAQKAAALKQGLQMAKCMRAHGVTNFPDPGSTGAVKFNGGFHAAMNPNSPIFQKALATCGNPAKGGKGSFRIGTPFAGGPPPPGGGGGSGGSSVGVAGGGTGTSGGSSNAGSGPGTK